jgi:HEAT repeat protein
MINRIGTARLQRGLGILLCGLLAIGLGIAGCGPHRPSGSSHSDGDTVTPQVPPAPPYRPQPLDPGIRQEALDELLNDCNDPDVYKRSNALEALSIAAPGSAQRPILAGLDDPDPGVRYTAAIAAGQLKLKPAYGPLLSKVDDNDLRVRAAVIFALHRLGDTRFSHDLEKLSEDPDARVRASTAQVLGLIGEPSATNVLTPMLTDMAASVRLQAAESLWRLGDEDGMKDLLAYTISSYPDDQMSAILALAQPGDARALPYVRGAMTTDYLEVNLTAARGMGMLGSDEGWNVAVPAAKSKEANQRSLAALAMGAIGRSDLQPYLVKLLRDQNTLVRISAATGLLQLHE